MKANKLTTTVMIAMLGTSVVAAPTTAMAASKKKNVEKCYGISKAKMNGCGTPKHSCAGQAKVNGDPSEWIYVLKGNCKRIVGGSTKPKSGGSDKS